MSKRGEYLHAIALFLIYLIIIIPMYSAETFAISFTATVSGTDGVPNFRRATNDMTTIAANATLDDKSQIANNQIKYLGDPTRPFDCTYSADDGANTCGTKISETLPGGLKTYDLQMFDTSFNAITEVFTLPLYVDDQPPKIESFEVGRAGDAITVNYTVTDSAFGDAEICSGIASVKASLDYGFQEKDYAGECLTTDNFTIEITKPAETVVKNICLEASDRLGQKTQECEEITLDFSRTTIINASLYLENKTLKEASTLPINDVMLVVYLKEESELLSETMSADLSQLNIHPDMTSAYGDINNQQATTYFGFSCINKSQGLYECVWKNIQLLIGSSNPQITITSQDPFGNVMNATATLSIVFDNVKPYVNTIRSDYIDMKAKYWVGPKNNSLFIDITETGSGFDDKKLFLDLKDLGKQTYAGDVTVLAPNDCIPGWTCEYRDVVVTSEKESGDSLMVSWALGSSDDAGNWLDGLGSTYFGYDNVPPQILNIVNSTICAASPDTIEYVINVSEEDSGGVKALVYATPFSTTQSPIEILCEETEDKDIWNCPISIGNLYTYHVEDELNITIIDLVKNENNITLQQEICEAVEGVEPNVVYSEATPMPTILDRIISGYIAYPAFAELELSYTAPNQVQDIKIESCTSAGASITEAYVVTPLEFKNPIIGFKIFLNNNNQTNSTGDTLEVDCVLDLIIQSGTKIYKMPEKENIIITFQLEGTVFGGLEQGMIDKLAGIEDEISSTKTQIKSYEGAINFFGTVCSIAEILAMITVLLQTLKLVLYIVGAILYAIGQWEPLKALKKAGNGLYFTPCKIADKITTLVTTGVWQTDLNPMAEHGTVFFTSTGSYLKILCAWFTCRFSETNNFMEMIINSGSANGGRYTFQKDGNDEKGAPNDAQEGVFSTLSVIGGDGLGIGSAVDYDWSAYRSYHVAWMNKCLPGMKYNLLKKEQNLCIKRNCINNLVSAGFSPEICDKLYATHQCLYFDSAAWVESDPNEFTAFMQGMNEWLLTQMIGAVGGVLMRKVIDCGYPYGWASISDALDTDTMNCGWFKETAITKGWQALLCGAAMSTNIWLDVGDWIDWNEVDWNMYEGNLKGEDYCAQGDT